MRTNIVIDNELMAQAQQLTGISTKRQVVEEALRLRSDSSRRLLINVDLAGYIDEVIAGPVEEYSRDEHPDNSVCRPKAE